MKQQAKIIDIQRMSTEDGPGLRTTVFFKGCNLACAWCHNPESINPKPDLNWYSVKCMNCNICKTICPNHVITKDLKGVHFDRSKCVACGKCVHACPQGAIELKGIYLDVDHLADELVKDHAYFGLHGGVTFSGGEPMLQSEILIELSKRLRAKGITSIALDTAGSYDWSLLEKVLPHVDIVLYDLKLSDDAESKKWIGAPTGLIKENYKKLMQLKKRVWVRTPIIPSATDNPENTVAIAKFIKANGLPERWELCAFNNLPLDKYERLGKEWPFKGKSLMTTKDMDELTTIAKEYVPMALWTGTAR